MKVSIDFRKFGIFAISFFAGIAAIHFADSTSLTRDPAAIRQYYDFTNLRGTALEMALKERVVSNLEIVKNANDVGLRLGHFAFTNPQEQKKLACDEYSKVILQFESADLAISGEKSKMEVESPCKASSDITMIEPIWLPLSKVYTEKASDGDFQFNDQQPVSVHFSNISDEWPKKWNLIGIRLSGAATDFRIDRNEVQKILGHPLVLSF